MKAQELREIAARLNRWADELDGIKTDGGGINVTLPGPTLFDAIEQAAEIEKHRVMRVEEPAPEPEPEAPAKRVYKRVGCKMRDEAIVAANKVGKAQGYCQRSDIERSLRRYYPDRSREEIREAVNAAVAELGLTCIVYNSYRYYRRSDRERIIENANKLLKR